MFTKEDKLPTLEELEVQEVDLGSSYLRAGGTFLGKYCEPENNEFVLCKKETGNPMTCLPEGKAVTACSLKFFQHVKKFCAAEFTTYALCLERSSTTQEHYYCRKTQYAFDACMKMNMGMDRPNYAYHTLARVHDSDRPKPDKRPDWLDDPRGSYGRPDVLPDDFEHKGYKPKMPY